MDFQIALLFADGAIYSGNTIVFSQKRLKKMRNRESESVFLVTFYLLWRQNSLSDGSRLGMTMLFPYYSSIFTFSFKEYEVSGSFLHWNTLLLSSRYQYDSLIQLHPAYIEWKWLVIEKIHSSLLYTNFFFFMMSNASSEILHFRMWMGFADCLENKVLAYQVQV